MIPIIANQGQESFNDKGALPDVEMDIHCKAYGGQDYKNNYWSGSCATRLKERTCPIGDACPRFKGPKPKRPNYTHTPATKDSMKAAMKKRTRECSGCHEVKWLYCGDLCRLCHEGRKAAK